MSQKRSAWLLNLDAEIELANRDAHTPSARALARMNELKRVLAPLFGPGDVILGGEEAPLEGEWLGRAWCPTPRARRRLLEAGATPVPAPDFAVLRRVNHRRFAAELGPMLPGARFVTTMDDLESTIRGATPTGHWLLKRPFGFAGRGRRRVAQGELERAAVDFVRASLRTGDGLQVEPWVRVVSDYALHGFIAQNGDVTFGEPTRQICDETGAWKETSVARDLSREEETLLGRAATRAADALKDAGYFGPFGIDAYRWHDGQTVRFQPLSEINARYSMGWAVGMGDRRVDLDVA
jgi:hypothetical protein